jgi:NAD(P)-dependent dehydrogenase (short-subunit alcohol dehydrogenase family)
VVLTGRRAERGTEAARLIRQNGAEAVFIQADVSTEDGTAAMIAGAVEHYGRLDTLVSNAAVALDAGRLDEIPTSAFEQEIATNVLGLFWGMKYAISDGP